MPHKRRRHPLSGDPLVDLLDVMLMDATASYVSAETARAVRALRHSAEYAVMAAHAMLEGSRRGADTSAHQMMQWAAIRLDEARCGSAPVSCRPLSPFAA
ncbi:hypothetical protein SAMN06265378_10986 [Paracoccus sediminis]|uniref:Uncharacterized protein n=1 Tax=Paracoccus sediminis TaxID=1214787 RepID=A0A238XDL5_9RHOB|nr:hypothetical protein SAMN06265378_10986 [Paracoccus sediminis]